MTGVHTWTLLVTALLSSQASHAQATWGGPELQMLMNQARELLVRKQIVDQHIQSLPPAPVPSALPQSSSRGIVMTIGGTDHLLNALVVAKVLRGNVSCILPIEIFYFGADQLDSTLAKSAQDISGLTLIDGNAVPYPGHHKKTDIAGWVSKAFALYMCSFSQVLLLDCDSQPLFDPTRLFTTPSFREKGSMFWPDYFEDGVADPWKTNAREEAFYLLGLDVPWKDGKPWRSTESGELVLDRTRHKDVLEYLLLINTHSDIIYKHTYGDKDTFEMAFMLAEKHDMFFQIPHRVRMALGDVLLTPEGVAYHRSIGNFQSDVTGRPFFYHRTMHKFKTSTDVAARSLLPTMVTESLTSELMMKELYHEQDIQDRHPNEPFDWRLALHAGGVSVASNCDQLQENSKRLVQWEVDHRDELLAEVGPCNSTSAEPLRDVVAIPLHWFGEAVPEGVEAAYAVLDELLTAYRAALQGLTILKPRANSKSRRRHVLSEDQISVSSRDQPNMG